MSAPLLSRLALGMALLSPVAALPAMADPYDDYDRRWNNGWQDDRGRYDNRYDDRRRYENRHDRGRDWDRHDRHRGPSQVVVVKPVPYPVPVAPYPRYQPVPVQAPASWWPQYGAYCREFQQSVLIDGRYQPAYGVACQQPDGDWRIVPGAR